MSHLLKIYFLSSNNRTCFFYRNEIELRNDKSKNIGIKIKYGKNFKTETYGSISLQALPEVPAKSIGVSSLLANRLGLRHGEEVYISPCSVNSISRLEIFPKKEEDYVILLTCKTICESHLLNQVSVVAEGQTLPLYVFSNVVIDIEIGKLESKFEYGKLEKFTEIKVLHPSEVPEKFTKKSIPKKVEENKQPVVKSEKTKQPVVKSEKNKEALAKFEKNKPPIFNHISQIVEKVNLSKGNKVQKESELILKSFFQTKETEPEYEIRPSFLLNNIPKKVKNKYVIVSNFANDKVNHGPQCLKFFSKIHKVNSIQSINNGKENKKGDDEIKNDIIYVHNNAVSLNENGSMIAFCPSHVMKTLKLYVGSKIKIRSIKFRSDLLSDEFQANEEPENFFWSSILSIRENIKQTIINNVMFNYKINTLIVGETGTGKTFLLEDIIKQFSDEYIYCKLVNCKTLRGKKIETLQKLWTDYLRDCCCYNPSILFLDDLHALIYVDEEDEGHYNKFYSNRVVDLITDTLESFQERFDISVVASAVSVSKLSSVVDVRGSRLFQNVHIISELDLSERDSILRYLVKSKTKTDAHDLNFSKISDNTKGYAIQDLNDLVDKAVFNCLVRDDSAVDNLSCLSQVDFDSVLIESTPLILRGVKLKENVENKWDDVGGMTEPKEILTEVFSWPSKYPKLLESCPLRLQRGVLLYGAPGTGKTLLAGAIANKCGLNFISVKGPEVLSKYVGASEEGVRNLFLQAQKTQPCLLFFDEFDSLAPKRGNDSTGVTDRVVNQLLTQLDGVEALSGVWVLAASSRPDMLDPALLRPGRLDKLVFCPVPEETDRLSILKALSKNLSAEQNIDLSKIAQKTAGYTGADLQAILYTAQMLAIKENKNNIKEGMEIKIKQNHLLAAISETKPSLSKSEKMKYDKIYEKFLNSRKRNATENYIGTQKVIQA